MEKFNAKYVLKCGREYATKLSEKVEINTDDFKEKTIHRVSDGKSCIFFAGDRLDYIEVFKPGGDE